MTKLFMSLEIWSDVLHLFTTIYFPKIILKEESIYRFVHFEGQIPWNPSSNVESQDGWTGLQFNEKVTIIEKS